MALNHHDQRPMRMGGIHAEVVGREEIPRKCAASLVGRRGQRDLGVRRSRKKDGGLGVGGDLVAVDDGDRDRLMGTRLDARGGFAHSQSRRTHIALPHDPFAGMVLGHVVRAGHRAVLAPEALVVEMLDDAGRCVLLVGIDGTSDHASRFETMMTRGSDVLHDGKAARTADEQPDVAPRFLLVQAIERVTCDDACLAPRAAIEINLKCVLLPGARRLGGEQLEGLIDFISVGARLLLIKSRALLPRPPVLPSDEVEAGRPHPFMIRLLMRRLGVEDPSRVAKVGDAPADLLEGQNAGCGLVIGVTGGASTREQLEIYPHDHLIGSVADLPALLEQKKY